MFAEFDKVVRCLALELPESVHADVVVKYGKLKAEVEKFTSTNNARDEICPNAAPKCGYRRYMCIRGNVENCAIAAGKLSPVA